MPSSVDTCLPTDAIRPQPDSDLGSCVKTKSSSSSSSTSSSASTVSSSTSTSTSISSSSSSSSVQTKDSLLPSNNLDKQHCRLDSNECISLDQVLETFNSPINEEQAWAICFQFVQCVRCILRKRKEAKPLEVQQMNTNSLPSSRSLQPHNNNHERLQLLLHRNGYVHENSLFAGVPLRDCPLINEQELLMTFGLTIFDALDYKIASDEELSISSPLESLLERLTLEIEELEEYEASSLNSDNVNLNSIYDICCSRLSDRSVAPKHYGNICKALVTETLELSMFLRTVYEGTKMREKLMKECLFLDNQNGKFPLNNNSTSGSNGCEMQRLPLADWAKLWMQVLQELRCGRKSLRPVKQRPKSAPTDSLAEIPLDQIEAHKLILRYIRSRPALMPVQQRKLGPPLRPPTRSLLEQLHESIRQGNIKLRPVKTESRNGSYSHLLGRVCDPSSSLRTTCSTSSASSTASSSSSSSSTWSSRQANNSSSSLDSSPMAQKKKLIIKPDISCHFDFDDEDDDLYFDSAKRYSSLF